MLSIRLIHLIIQNIQNIHSSHHCHPPSSSLHLFTYSSLYHYYCYYYCHYYSDYYYRDLISILPTPHSPHSRFTALIVVSLAFLNHFSFTSSNHLNTLLLLLSIHYHTPPPLLISFPPSSRVLSLYFSAGTALLCISASNILTCC